jgi:cell pole-organizing protein PopZ
MSETNQEPTMEEILASIRRIISEDDAPAEGEAAAEAAPAAEALPDLEAELEAAPEAPEALPDLEIPTAAEAPPLVLDDDVLELTDRLDDPLDEPEALAMSDLEVVAPAPRYEPPPADLPPMSDDEPLVSDPQAYTAASAFEALERNILMPGEGRTLEDVVRELLRPMMKAWLDENLPGIVEQQVAAEVERIARLRRGG